MSTQSSVMPCGTELDELVRQVFGDSTALASEHQEGCAHCRSALRRIGEVHADMSTLVAESVPVPRTLLGSVMARLRRSSTLVTIDLGPRGTTAVAESVVTAVARRAALSVVGVAYASAIAAEASPTGPVGLRLRLVVAYGPSLSGVAEQVRAEIARQVTALTGASIGVVHISVDDLA